MTNAGKTQETPAWLEPFLAERPERIAYTFQAVAELCGHSDSWLYERVRAGTVAYVRVGRNLILVDDLQRMMDPTYPRDGRDTLREAFIDSPPMRVADVAHSLSVCHDTILRKRIELRAFQDCPGGCWRIRREDLIAFLLERRVPTRWEKPEASAMRPRLSGLNHNCRRSVVGIAAHPDPRSNTLGPRTDPIGGMRNSDFAANAAAAKAAKLRRTLRTARLRKTLSFAHALRPGANAQAVVDAIKNGEYDGQGLQRIRAALDEYGPVRAHTPCEAEGDVTDQQAMQRRGIA